MSVALEKIRNFAVAGHTGCGKTALSDLMLFKAKAVDRLGSVDSRTSVSDYTPDEQEKLSSIYAAALNCQWGDYRFFFMDTPGYGEFIGEAIASIHVSDAVLIVVDGAKGLEIGSSKAWKLAKERGIPRFFLVNRLDREMADFGKVLSDLQDAYGKTVCVPMTVPVGKEAGLKSVVNVLKCKDVPADIASEVKAYREQLMDAIAESDEKLMEKYLEGQELTDAEVSKGLQSAVKAGKLVPVFASSVAKDIGVDELMNSIASLFPDPASTRAVKLEDGTQIEVKEDGPGLGLAFKSILDPFIGQLSFFRVVSGKFKPDSEVFNLSTGEKERFATLLVMNGKTQTQVAEALPGTIAAVTKLRNTHISNTLSTAQQAKEKFAQIPFPNPVMSYAVTPVKSGDEEKISAGLAKLCDSDPTIRKELHPETHELLVYGMGDQHLSQIAKKLKNSFKVEVNMASPRIPYRETITGTGEGHYRHKKQSGGHGQFAEVFLKISPNPAGYEFKNDIFGGSIPKNFIPAVEKGVAEAMVKGPLAGCIVQNITVSVYDGKHHEVDSSEMAFKIASRSAFKLAMNSANPILLEPIYNVKITIPDEHLGAITGDMNHKRGRILGMSIEEGMQVVQAEVPLAEMARYASELRSITQGSGSFEMEFARYEMVPSNVARTIIENYNKTQAEEKE